MSKPLDIDKILEKADTLYSVESLKRSNIPAETYMYWAPEMFPKIQSEQVKCATRAIVEALNAYLTGQKSSDIEEIELL